MTQDTNLDDDKLTIKLSGGFSLIELSSGKIISSESVYIKYIGAVNEENNAFIAYGIKLGEVINELKF